MRRERLKWIASLSEPLDQGAGTPAFPYALFRSIAQRSDVLEALGPDCTVIEAELGKNAFAALVDVIWELNCFPRLFTSHTLAWADDGMTIPGEFEWAAHRAHCQLCILPRDQEVPDLETCRRIVNELHGTLLDCVRARHLKPPDHTLVFLEPVVMKFGLKSQGLPKMGFGVHMIVDGYAGRVEQAQLRCSRALVMLADLLRLARD